MRPNVLVHDIEKYEGKYVAIRTFIEKNVVCFGDDPAMVFEEAQSRGADDPVIFYVPKKDVVHIYTCR
ncbi:MAG: hypothetical protein HQL08_00565 [Nitrospirae bacterium]|nr:hypothetical protein [Nitrospirota bacterium]